MLRLESSISQALLVLALVACAAQSSASKSESLEPLPGCPGRVGKTDGTTWHEVQADGFSFCVPTDWRQESRTLWRGNGGSITWSDPTAERRPFTIGKVNSGTATQGVKDYWRATEMIGGVPASLYRNRGESSYVTSATWQSRRLTLSGDATSPSAAQRQLDIYRTVRFPSPD